MRFRAIHKVMSEDYLLQILPVKVCMYLIKFDKTYSMTDVQFIELQYFNFIHLYKDYCTVHKKRDKFIYLQ